MLCSKPAIGCNAGGVSKVVLDEETGLLAQPGNGPTLEKAIDRLIKDKQLRKRLGENAMTLNFQTTKWLSLA